MSEMDPVKGSNLKRVVFNSQSSSSHFISSVGSMFDLPKGKPPPGLGPAPQTVRSVYIQSTTHAHSIGKINKTK